MMTRPRVASILYHRKYLKWARMSAEELRARDGAYVAPINRFKMRRGKPARAYWEAILPWGRDTTSTDRAKGHAFMRCLRKRKPKKRITNGNLLDHYRERLR